MNKLMGTNVSEAMPKRNKNADKTKFIYDLNIFQMEQLNGDGEYEHMGPWYIHIYEYENSNIEEVGNPIELTQEEYANLIYNDPYFNNEVDVWYGLEGFVLDKWDSLSVRLKHAFECLPKYKEDLLF
jgi:hypothetical protein